MAAGRVQSLRGPRPSPPPLAERRVAELLVHHVPGDGEVDRLVAAALGQSANVRHVPADDPGDGVAALLRW